MTSSRSEQHHDEEIFSLTGVAKVRSRSLCPRAEQADPVDSSNSFIAGIASLAGLRHNQSPQADGCWRWTEERKEDSSLSWDAEPMGACWRARCHRNHRPPAPGNDLQSTFGKDVGNMLSTTRYCGVQSRKAVDEALRVLDRMSTPTISS